MMKFFRLNALRNGVAAFAIVAASSSVWAQNSSPKSTNAASNRVSPLGGNVDPFGGNVDPFARNVDPFGGNVDPFTGNVDPFGGNVDPFKGNVDPFANGIPLNSQMLGGFWRQFGANWQAFGASMERLRAAPTDFASQFIAANQLQSLVMQSEIFWGQRVQQRTGKSFRAGFSDALLAKYRLSLSDPSSFARLSAADQTRFAFEWFDGLNNFSGIDQVDYWMKAVNWNPNLTLVQGSGSRSVIGIVDGKIATTSELNANVKHRGGSNSNANEGHGAAILSLITAAHDGKGVQGIAPQASVISYNPFDDTGTTSWSDIASGVKLLQANRASVINLSLGQKGYTFSSGWRDVFANPDVAANAGKSVYIVAAGNDGVAQTSNVALDGANNPALVLVGSVGPTGVISNFSNRPGNACITVAATCQAGNYLRDRFLVAPGEALLVSDGAGGVTRVSGTSFAAPLVSGAVTLMHNRWPWLVNYPAETTNILLSTARDLGAPGVDDIYGRGMLDVEAAQSPINFDAVQFQEFRGNGTSRSALTATAVKTRTLPANFEVDGLFYYLIETTGRTHRDFAVPLASRLYGQRTSVNGSSEYFQDYVTRRMNGWINRSRGTAGFTDATTLSNYAGNGLRVSYQLLPATDSELHSGKTLSFAKPNLRVALPDDRFGLSLGYGDGGRVLGEQAGFGLGGDYEASNGGINPILGLASGGTFLKADAKIDSKTTLSIGFTENRSGIENNLAIESNERSSLSKAALDDYAANGLSIQLDYQPVANVELSFSYARVDEANAIFGVQSLANGDFDSGFRSHTGTIGASLSLKNGFSLSASGTLGHTSSRNGDGLGFSTAGNGVTSNAFAIAVSKQGVLSLRDMLRVSVIKPLTVSKGELEFTSIQVIDRSTGELGPVTQRFGIEDQSQRYIGEFVYATPLASNGEFSLFGRAEYKFDQENGDSVDGMVIGGRLSMPF